MVGVVLLLVSVAVAPIVASFYGEPRLRVIMDVLGLSFVFNAAGVQHSALLQRQLRFTTLAVIDVIALAASSAISMVLALRGFGYWALVAWSTTLPLVTTIQLWFHARWIPGKAALSVGTRSLLRFGSIVTLNTLVVHIAYNLDKVLLGRFWGAEVVGIYGRAYQLVTLPTEQINSTIGGVAISVLSRLQNDRKRLWGVLPKGLFTGIGRDSSNRDDVRVVRGANRSRDVRAEVDWCGSRIRLLVPTVFAFAIINPTGWVLVALGMVGRSLKIALVIAPIVIIGCVAGLPYGANGVALGFSVAISLWIVPHMLWCFHGTGVPMQDVLFAIGRPVVSAAVAAPCAWAVLAFAKDSLATFSTLVLGVAVFMSIYVCVLLFAMKQSAFYLDIFRNLRQREADDNASRRVVVLSC